MQNEELKQMSIAVTVSALLRNMLILLNKTLSVSILDKWGESQIMISHLDIGKREKGFFWQRFISRYIWPLKEIVQMDLCDPSTILLSPESKFSPSWHFSFLPSPGVSLPETFFFWRRLCPGNSVRGASHSRPRETQEQFPHNWGKMSLARPWSWETLCRQRLVGFSIKRSLARGWISCLNLLSYENTC